MPASQTSVQNKKNTVRMTVMASKKSLRRRLRPIVDDKSFKAGMMVCLVFALFGGSFWSLCDIPDEGGNTVLDTLMTTVLVIFLIEIVFTCLVDYRDYPWSLFFWMDIIGSVSMVFEISYLAGGAGKATENASAMDTMILRTARATKLGARMGRLTKILKCLAVIIGGKKPGKAENGEVNARVISKQLMLTLSTKVSLLTVLLVLIIPLFSFGRYPEEDYSMRAWASRLERDYSRAYAESVGGNGVLGNPQTTIFAETRAEFEEFYQELPYQPFKLEGFPLESVGVDGVAVVIPGGTHLLNGEAEPNRQENVVIQPMQTCMQARPGCEDGTKARIYFTFAGPKQLEAALDILMIVFIVFVMVGCTFVLNRTLDSMVVRPLERMLGMVRGVTSNILHQVSKIKIGDTDDDGKRHSVSSDDGGMGAGEDTIFTEIELLEQVLMKFTNISKLLMQRNVVDEEEMAGLSEEARGVIVDVMGMGSAATSGRMSMVHPDINYSNEEVVNIVQKLPVDLDIIESYDYDVLALEPDDLRNVVLYIFYDSPLGRSTGRMWIDPETFLLFHAEVKKNYYENPYHNYAHACDVTHSVYRSMMLTDARQWVGDVEQYALLVAAFCHDIGHRGVANPFLIETKHELALRYNDKSPLENMHAASLFNICTNEVMNVFKRLTGDMYKQARKVCVLVILHTDNANHFEMVKDINTFYEVTSEVCDLQAKRPTEIHPQYESDVLLKDTVLWLEVFLHLADVSNPLKPFGICKAWAWKVLDEFFAQGDEEKRLGIPVGMLNDREKVNKPGSQHGFINFLVAPLALGAVKVFPILIPLADQMAENLGSWRDVWITESNPSVEDIAKRDADVKKVSESVQVLRDKQLKDGGRNSG